MGSKRKIKIPYAYREGRLTHVSKAVSGRKCGCFCVVCGEPLVAKKGESRQPHFAHDKESECKAETALHRIGKLLIKERVDLAIATGSEIPLRWACPYCNENHEANLLKKARRCELEHPIATARADVVLLDSYDIAYAALEIVVTHMPEEATEQIYKKNNIRLLRFDLKSEADLLKLTAPEGVRPDFVDHCVMPRCPGCQTFLRQRKLYVADKSCWRCGRLMKLTYAYDGRTIRGPEAYADFEIEVARKEGVILNVRYSKMSNRQYMANVCPHCYAMSGNFFLHREWEDMREKKVLQISLGCIKCKKIYRSGSKEIYT